MLERVIVRNFKRFEEAEVELGQNVLLIGPNNAGKTSVLQALALWEIGLRRWHEKKGKGSSAKVRRGVAINRRDLLSAPVPDSKLLWRDLHVRDVERDNGKQRTQNVRLEIVVHGVVDSERWECGLEFDFANAESIYCRPISPGGGNGPGEVPAAALQVRMAFLQPMSGLAASELRLEPGAIQVRLGDGRTAEVLRNLCYQLSESRLSSGGWNELQQKIGALFGVSLDLPEYIVERGEITMSYRDRSGVQLDISSAGRGLQQTLLLLAFLYTNPGSVLLLDEPDAHLEILRQRQVYDIVTTVAREVGGQVIAASHSEVLLNEAADRDVVVAFVGKPHRIDDRGHQAVKALKSIGFEHYYLAEERGWVLYLEGATDLRALAAFAQTLGHPAAADLERPFVHYVGNQLSQAKSHFYGLREAAPSLVGIAVLDHEEGFAPEKGPLTCRRWSRREIENYLCFPEVLERYAEREATQLALPGPLFEQAEVSKRRDLMRSCVSERIPPAAMRDPADDWWRTVKASDEFLDRVFAEFYRRLDLPNLMTKSDYHELAGLVPAEQIDREVVDVLDRIHAVALRAQPV